MPTNLSVSNNMRLKRLKLIALFLLSPLLFFGQTLTGLWTGALSNDSTTIRKDQSFEIALTEYKGKVYGYSRSEFIVDDTLYYMVKRVKGTIDGDVCEVSDDEIISYNFRGKLDKGIKVTSIFRRNQNDSAWYLDGTWKTNATKKYYSVTGKVNLEEEKDLTASKIFPHLEELKLADDIAFYKERKEGPAIAKLVKPSTIKTEYSTKIKPVLNNTDFTVAPAKPDLQRAEARPVPVAAITPDITSEKEEVVIAVKKPENNLPEIETKTIATGSVNITPTISSKKIAENKAPEVEIAAVTKPTEDLPKTNTKNIPTSSVDVTPVSSNKSIAKNKIPVAEIKNSSSVSPSSVADNKSFKVEPVVKTSVKQEQSITQSSITSPQQKQNETKTVVKTITPNTSTVIKPTTVVNKQDVASANPVKTNAVVSTTPEKKETRQTESVAQVKPITVTAVSVVPEEKKPVVDIIAKAALVAGRKSEFSQIVSFKADSLELSLYDNGEIDGDTVSVYMNGEVILSKQGLKASAIKKTIYITPGNEDFTLVLFAENLGKYAPNTGLLVVHDGDDVYNLRFSSDFQKNAGIVFRRKK